MEYIPFIGLEIHVELKTKSKMFCSCSANYFGEKPNIYTCPVCLGLPGALPVPNKKAIEWCIKLGLALNCQIAKVSKFDRKNYFYPDLPKGYQISQYDLPFCRNGYLMVGEKKIRIRRVHMEEDTAKLLHQDKVTLIDFNRSGVPLVEIVTEPDIRSSEEAKRFLQELYLIVRYLNISDADMEKGSMRLEPNISVLNSQGFDPDQDGAYIKLPKYKVEVKNINSFNFVKKAIDYEISRQKRILEEGCLPVQETRGWDEIKGITYSQRSKEEAHDYRYFPEPDIPPFFFTDSDIKNLKNQLPELPGERRERFVKELRIKLNDAYVLIAQKEKADFLDKALNIVRQLRGEKISAQELANWIINERIDIRRKTATSLVRTILEQRKKSEISFDIVIEAVKTVIDNHPQAVLDFKKGKKQVLMFLLGHVLKLTRGKGDPYKIKTELLKLLK